MIEPQTVRALAASVVRLALLDLKSTNTAHRTTAKMFLSSEDGRAVVSLLGLCKNKHMEFLKKAVEEAK